MTVRYDHRAKSRARSLSEVNEFRPLPALHRGATRTSTGFSASARATVRERFLMSRRMEERLDLTGACEPSFHLEGGVSG